MEDEIVEVDLNKVDVLKSLNRRNATWDARWKEQIERNAGPSSKMRSVTFSQHSWFPRRINRLLWEAMIEQSKNKYELSSESIEKDAKKDAEKDHAMAFELGANAEMGAAMKASVCGTENEEDPVRSFVPAAAEEFAILGVVEECDLKRAHEATVTVMDPMAQESSTNADDTMTQGIFEAVPGKVVDSHRELFFQSLLEEAKPAAPRRTSSLLRSSETLMLLEAARATRDAMERHERRLRDQEAVFHHKLAIERVMKQRGSTCTTRAEAASVERLRRLRAQEAKEVMKLRALEWRQREIEEEITREKRNLEALMVSEPPPIPPPPVAYLPDEDPLRVTAGVVRGAAAKLVRLSAPYGEDSDREEPELRVSCNRGSGETTPIPTQGELEAIGGFFDEMAPLKSLLKRPLIEVENPSRARSCSPRKAVHFSQPFANEC